VTSTGNAECFENRFTMVFQMLLCGKCYEKRSHIKAYKLSIVRAVEVVERWIVRTPLSVNVLYHSPHSNMWDTIVNIFLKHPVCVCVCVCVCVYIYTHTHTHIYILFADGLIPPLGAPSLPIRGVLPTD
jgi:hypothetical protein